MHKYNNQDHSMITALYYDLWAVNTEPDYHEEKERKQNYESRFTELAKV